MAMDTLLYSKWITDKDLFYSQGTLLNVMWQPGWEGGLGRTDMYICMAEFLCWSSETMTIVLLVIPQHKIKSLKKNKTHPLLSIR